MSWETLGAACAIVVHDNAVLLTRQRRTTATFWELPGGYVDPGETFEQAAAREALEETGLAVEVGKLVCTLLWERAHRLRRNIVMYFAATALDPSGQLHPQLEEGIDAVRFVDLGSIDLETIHPMERLILKRWPQTGYHLHADVVDGDDGVPVYAFR